jgi:hypothetical protein
MQSVLKKIYILLHINAFAYYNVVNFDRSRKIRYMEKSYDRCIYNYNTAVVFMNKFLFYECIFTLKTDQDASCFLRH